MFKSPAYREMALIAILQIVIILIFSVAACSVNHAAPDAMPNRDSEKALNERQLLIERLQMWDESQKYHKTLEALSQDNNTCKDEHETCVRIKLLHGKACYEVATYGGDNPAEKFQCAVDQLDAGLTMAKKLQPEKIKINILFYEQLYLEALEKRRDFETDFKILAKYNAVLVKQAERYRRLYPESVDGYYYSASAAFWNAQLDFLNQANVTGCRSLEEVKGFSEKLNPQPAKFDQRMISIRRYLEAGEKEYCGKSDLPVSQQNSQPGPG